MASVRSIEKFTLTLAVGVATVSGTLTKSQDAAQCVPFATKRVGSILVSPADDYDDMNVDITISGTTVKADRLGTDGIMIVEVFVVEFQSDMSIQQGTFTLSGSSTTEAISALTLAKSFLIFHYQSTVATPNTLGDNAVRGRYTSTTQLTFSRGASGGTLSGHWYSVEDTAGNFDVDAASITIGVGSEIGSAIVPTVDENKTFVVASYQADSGVDDDVAHGAVRARLISSTTVEVLRGGALFTIDAEVYVVELLSADESVQRALLTFSTTSSQETKSITAIDQAKAVVHSPMRQPVTASAHTVGTDSSDNPDVQVAAIFQSNTVVQADRNNNGAEEVRFDCEVIEFEDVIDEKKKLTTLLMQTAETDIQQHVETGRSTTTKFLTAQEDEALLNETGRTQVIKMLSTETDEAIANERDRQTIIKMILAETDEAVANEKDRQTIIKMLLAETDILKQDETGLSVVPKFLTSEIDKALLNETGKSQTIKMILAEADRAIANERDRQTIIKIILAETDEAIANERDRQIIIKMLLVETDILKQDETGLSVVPKFLTSEANRLIFNELGRIVVPKFLTSQADRLIFNELDRQVVIKMLTAQTESALLNETGLSQVIKMLLFETDVMMQDETSLSQVIKMLVTGFDVFPRIIDVDLFVRKAESRTLFVRREEPLDLLLQ